jgi:hypothetical protein
MYVKYSTISLTLAILALGYKRTTLLTGTGSEFRRCGAPGMNSHPAQYLNGYSDQR